jgi:hypothetical protein
MGKFLSQILFGSFALRPRNIDAKGIAEEPQSMSS